MITREYLNKSTHPPGSGRHMATKTPLRDYRILQVHVNGLKKEVFKLGVSTLRLPDARMRTNTRHDVYMTWLVIISSTAHDTLRAACSALAFIFTVHYTVHPTCMCRHFHYLRDSTTTET